MVDIKNGMTPAYPGEILRDEIESADLTAVALLQALARLTKVLFLNGRESLTADTVLRLARCFGTAPELRFDLQQTRELRWAETAIGQEMVRPVTPWQSAA